MKKSDDSRIENKNGSRYPSTKSRKYSGKSEPDSVGLRLKQVKARRKHVYIYMFFFSLQNQSERDGLRARFNEERTIRKSSRFQIDMFSLVESISNRFGGNIVFWLLSGNHVCMYPSVSVPVFDEIENTQHSSHNNPTDKHRGERMRARVCIVPCVPMTASFFFGSADSEAITAQLHLGGQRKP